MRTPPSRRACAKAECSAIRRNQCVQQVFEVVCKPRLPVRTLSEGQKMTLEDFEKTLAEEKNDRQRETSKRHYDHEKRHRQHKHRHHGEDREHHRHKRRKQSDPKETNIDDPQPRKRETTGYHPESHRDASTSYDLPADERAVIGRNQLQRDGWMQEPSALDIDYVQRGGKRSSAETHARSAKADFELKIHENELNKHHLQDLAAGNDIPQEIRNEPATHTVDYTFGDAGASWRMTKLKGVYRKAEDMGKEVDELAREQYGDLRLFDDAREERTELERRETYGEGYVGKVKPSGELFADRKIELGVRRPGHEPQMVGSLPIDPPKFMETESLAAVNVPMDQSALNRLKARMMKAKIKGGPEAASLEQEYNAASAKLSNCTRPDVVVLGAKDNRMLAGSRQREVRPVGSKRGRERGLVEDNEDMSIEDMVREERRTRRQDGGDGRRFAERIAKDGKFDNDLDYLDENAAKLARRVQKSDINLRNMAISDFQKINKILDTCPLCHHEDTDKPPLAPIVSLGTRVYLTLPTEPEISDGGACIIPIQHRDNLLHCDDDEWEEIRNFMKSLTRMYHDQGRDVIFYENAATPHRKKHAGLEVVPLPYSLGETAPAFFKEAILTTDEEWTQHKKIIDTLLKAKNGLGKSAFRRTLAKEMPYFHVWFELDGGLGHIVEDSNRWPKGDLFAREIIGGILDKGPEIIKRQGRWTKAPDPRLDAFRKRWRKFDWTRVLHDG